MCFKKKLVFFLCEQMFSIKFAYLNGNNLNVDIYVKIRPFDLCTFVMSAPMTTSEYRP